MNVMKEELLGAIARGWCSKENEHKIMDPELALAIADEVMPLIARVRTETLDAVEAGMPEEKPRVHIPDDAPRSLIAMDSWRYGWNDARDFALAHLRALREGDK